MIGVLWRGESTYDVVMTGLVPVIHVVKPLKTFGSAGNRAA
jgi:hypothetical protein